jgi:tetratricopeptide (TPR) repeat protein
MSDKKRYFSPLEWRGFWITTLVSFAVYLFTLQPNVGLEDSGELLTASYHMGVPHPPGYPSWTISAFLFEFIPFGNAAWRVNMMSAFYGALAAGMLALLTARFASGLWRMERFKNFSLQGLSNEALCVVAGCLSGLLFAFTDTMWSQAVIAEVYTLNGFFFTALCLMVLRWMDAPQSWRWPALIGLFFGLGITNHQTLIAGSLAFFFVMVMVNREYAKDVAFLGTIACAIFAWQTGLTFIWLITSLIAGTYIVLMALELDRWSFRNLYGATFSLLWGALAMAAFAEDKGADFGSSAFWASPRGQWLIGFSILGSVFAAMTFLDITSGRRALRGVAPYVLSFFAFISGFSLYLYMPLSSFTNPPMNWGHVQSVEEFKHHITRRQYERISIETEMDVLSNQFQEFFKDLERNFSFPFILLAVLAFVFLQEYRRKEKVYMAFTTLCFFFLGLFLVFLLNPKFDEQSTFINRVFYSLAHGVFSLWIGMGMILLVHLIQSNPALSHRMNFLRLALLFSAGAFLLFLLTAPTGMVYAEFGNFFRKLGGALSLNESIWRSAAWLVGICLYLLFLSRAVHAGKGRQTAALISILPVVSLCLGWRESEQRGHDFGWVYGHRMLKDVDRNAVIYGGTDPGRFVPTYMIFVESFQPKRWRRDPEFDRRDLYIITQNALADETYMNYIRDHYDTRRPKMDRWYHKLLGRDELYPEKTLNLPDSDEFNAIFQQVIDQNRGRPNSWVKVEHDEHGNVKSASVQGVEGVFAINAAVAQWIFEQNKHQHSFYVEESFPLNWMYPYLEPHGLIMKLNPNPIPGLDEKVVRRDMAYWSSLNAELLSDPAFVRDSVARKSFSKLRSSLGGLYLYRGLAVEAEKALIQSQELYPASAEARARLLELYIHQGRFAEAVGHCKEWIRLDPNNPAATESYRKLQHIQELADKERELQALYPFSKHDPNYIFQYVNVLKDRGKLNEADQILARFMAENDIDLRYWYTAVEFYTNINRPDRVETVLAELSRHMPNDANVHFNLAAVRAFLGKTNESLASLKKAIQINPAFKQTAASDPRFQGIHSNPEFQRLLK